MLSEQDLAVARVAQEIREQALADPIFFGAYVLGYDYLENPAWFHKEAAELEVAEKDFMLLAPRNHIKTTICDVVFPIHYVLRYPNSRQLIGMYTFANAGLVLREITTHFRANKKFRALFPEYVPNNFKEEGNQSEFTVPCRTRFPKEASFEIAGQDTAITSRHYDIIRCSDLVVRENVPPTSNPEQMQRTIEWFQTTVALLDTTLPNARITVDGTRWHDGDLYGYLIEDPGYNDFDKIICGIEDDDEGQPIEVWPQIPTSMLKKLRARTSDYFWAANYRNDPLPPEHAARFDVSWFRMYDEAPEILDIAITVDLAFTDSGKNLEKADRTAIIVSGIDEHGDLYILVTQAGRWGSKEITDRLFDLNAIWEPTYVGVESNSAQKLMLDILETEQRHRKQVIPLKPLIPDANKPRRAMIMSNHAQRYGIYIRPEHQMLVDECVRFPMGKHDDLVDALTYRGRDLAFMPRRGAEEEVGLKPRDALFGTQGADLIDAIHSRNSGSFLPMT